MAETLESFFTALCRRMGWEPTAWCINVLKTMAQMEGYPSVIQLDQTWNPLDTMHPTGAVGNWNAAGVKIYPNLAAGVEATARTLEQPNFSNLRETLRTQQVNEGTAADLRLWGWQSPNLLNTILNAMGGTAMPNGTNLPGRETVGPETALTTRAKPVTGQETGGSAASDVIPWLAQFFRDIPGDPPYTAYEQASDLFYEDPFKAIDLWRRETGQEAAVPAWEREATEARTAVNWANAQEIIARLGGDRYEDERNRILDKIDQENWTAEHAIKEFNAWMSGTLEAGKRAETVYGEQMERATYTRPTETYERPAHRQVMESYGLTYTPERGIPVETLPNLGDMYGEWQGRMGISEQAPPLPGGAGPTAQAPGAQEARRFIDDLLNKHRQRQGAGVGY